MRIASLVLVSLVLTSVGCESRRAGAPSRPSTAAEGPLAATSPDSPSANPMPELPPPEAFPPAPPSPDPHDEQRTNEALSAAADSAERAAAGTDDCESAHNQLLAMYETVERELGGTMHRPARDEFIEVCRSMPPAARKCIVPTYAMAHQDECSVALDALPEDVAQRFQVVVNGPGAD